MIYILDANTIRPANSFLVLNDNDFDKFRILGRELTLYKRVNRIPPFDVDPLKKMPIKDIWKPVEVELVSKAKNSKIRDITKVLQARSFVFSDKAREVLGDMLEENGEFLEIHCVDDGKTYYLYNVLTYVDILDHEKTKEYSKNITRLYYKENVDFDKLSIFRIFSRQVYHHTYITKKFVEIFQNNKLKWGYFTEANFLYESVTNKEKLEQFLAFNDLPSKHIVRA